MNFELRPYQLKARDETLYAFRNRHKSSLVVLPTGCGKTATMSAIAEVVVKNGGKVLFLAHRTTLVNQGAKAIEQATGIPVGREIGKAELPKESIIVSTVQTMSKDDKLEKYGPNYFGLIMIDESHHIPASSYQKILSFFTRARILGVTATPKRGDKTDVTDLFETVSSEYTLYEAIKDGYLSPIKVQTCPLQIDISQCEMQAGDYASGDIGAALVPYLDHIADQIIEKARNRKTIIFVPLVSTAKGMVEIFQSKGISADYVAGERKDSEKVLEAYHNDEFDILINSILLAEGYDEPRISCVVNLRITKSEALYTQIIGRGTRLAEGKEELLVLDFLWKDKEKRRHLNAKSCIAIGDTSISDEDLDSVLDSCELSDEEPTDVFQGIERAKIDAKTAREEALAHALKEAETKAKMEALRQQQRDAQLQALSSAKQEMIQDGFVEKVNQNLSIVKDRFGNTILYSISGDNVIQLMGLTDYYPEGMSWESDIPTESQLTKLQNFGIPASYIGSKGHGGFLMAQIFEREKQGLCSYKQLKLLMRYQPGDLSHCTKKIAKKAMDILNKNHWKPTPDFYMVLNGREFSSSDMDKDLLIG